VEDETKIEASQYLTFSLADELFALDIRAVREVLDFAGATRVPQMPEYMRGVINLRGSVVPVVDLRLLFGMASAAETVNTCVIIVDVELAGEGVIMGAMADAVEEVLYLEPDQIAPPPHLGTTSGADFICGMGKHDNGFLMILDIDKVFANSDRGALLDDLESAA
jgi:purine-binding chemotaxis protein CheW